MQPCRCSWLNARVSQYSMCCFFVLYTELLFREVCFSRTRGVLGNEVMLFFGALGVESFFLTCISIELVRSSERPVLRTYDMIGCAHIFKR